MEEFYARRTFNPICLSHICPLLIATVFEESEEPRMTDSLSTAQPFVCGGLSACFASSIVHPVDLAKVRLQLFAVEHAGKARPSFPQIITTMVKKEGFISIYSGLSAALARQCVYGTARIGLHRTFSDLLQKRNDGKPLNFGYKALRYLILFRPFYYGCFHI